MLKHLFEKRFQKVSRRKSRFIRKIFLFEKIFGYLDVFVFLLLRMTVIRIANHNGENPK
jgi:hypothetical protein